MKNKTKVNLLLISGALGLGTFLALRSLHANEVVQAVEREAHSKKTPGGEVSDRSKSKKKESAGTHTFSSVAEDKRWDKDLSTQETIEFLADVDNVFGRLLLAGVDKEAARAHLSRLNERGLAGVKAIAAKLSSPPSAESEVHARIAYADYLLYRARFDPEARRIAIDVAKVVPSESIAPKVRGAMFAERGELLGALVAIDFENAEGIFSQLAHPLLRRVAAAETVLRLSQDGIPIEEARKKVKAIIPEYKI
jgi:hypothetical protein